MAALTAGYWRAVTVKTAPWRWAASARACWQPAESMRSHSWERARTGSGMAATHSSTKLAMARPSEALPARARTASTSPVSPHRPSSGERATPSCL